MAKRPTESEIQHSAFEAAARRIRMRPTERARIVNGILITLCNDQNGYIVFTPIGQAWVRSLELALELAACWGQG